MKEVIHALTMLQKGYKEKNAENASIVVEEIFSNRQDIMILGTGSSELCLGREEAIKLIHDDWDGGWGDFTIDIDGAKIEVDGDSAWFYADCTVKYSFEDSDDNNKSYIDFVKSNIENQDMNPKQKLSFLNWALGLSYHMYKPGKRDYLWPTELSGMLVKENGVWKIAALHFASAMPDYPDERLEEPTGEYLKSYHATRDKIMKHSGNKADCETIDFLKRFENETAHDVELSGQHFDSEQVLVFDSGQFAWIMALGTIKQSNSENEIFQRSLKEVDRLLDSDLLVEEKLFQIKRNIAYALKESASGAEFTWPVRLTAVVEKTESGYKFRHKHFSYPFYWIFEGKL